MSRPPAGGTNRSMGSKWLAFGLCLLCAVAYGQDVPQGIWKSYVPDPGSMHGEFENNDPVGLAANAQIKADCSLRWVDPRDHKMYCFSSGTSLELFLDETSFYLERARKAWEKLHPPDRDATSH